jgi:hypothetical protein
VPPDAPRNRGQERRFLHWRDRPPERSGPGEPGQRHDLGRLRRDCRGGKTLRTGPSTPFPLPAHRTGHADFPHPALGPGSFWRHARCPALAWPSDIASVVASGSSRALLDSSSIASFPCCSVRTLEPGLLPSTGITRLQRYYEPLRHPLRPDAQRACWPPWPPKWASRVARRPLLTCCHPPPRRSGPGSSSSASRSIAAFPQSRQGRPSHRDFRGRLGVHSRYGLPACRQPEAASFLPGFSRFVASTTAEIATRMGRPLPGRDFHPLE